MPKVSVVIPVYNTEKYLERCLKSVCSQTLSDIEIICINDCSADNSFKILQEFAQNDSRIICLDFDKNCGVAAARNSGIEISHGEYVAFVDSDDFIAVDFCEKLYQKAKEKDADCVAGNVKKIDWSETAQEQFAASSQLAGNKLLFHHAAAALYKKEFLLLHTLFFPVKLRFAANSVFEVMAASCAKEIAAADNAFYYSCYRDNSLQSESGHTLKKMKDTVIALKMIIDRVDALDIGIAAYYEALSFRLSALSAYSAAQDFDENCKDFLAHAERKLLDCMKRKQEFLKYENFLQTQKFWTEKLTLKYDRVMIDEKIKNSVFCGIAKEKRKPRLIVSLTSFPERMHDIQYCLYSLLTQSLQPDEIILWLGEEEFPHGKKDIPHEVLKLENCGLTIKFTKDIKSYKKLIPALKEYPDDVLITADDDIYYPANWLAKLAVAHKKFEGDIICHRAHLIKFTPGGNISPYNTWKKAVHAAEPSCLYFCTTGAGVLYPPHALHKDAAEESRFLQLAPFADDIWFWAMAVLNGKQIRIVENPMTELVYVNPQREYRMTNELTLAAQNISQGQNNEQLKNILSVYPEISERLKEAKKALAVS